ncbi:pyridoxamine 5'-phosphate oxidase family protein [Rhizohabitans arisaemae]|uniref:pyridoxamine 5'-phosphate oxidase family protein n=1 Tax=Rhizohabitans arisaemae TaxID=2720610 RepID=UPI0024B22A44|nr:pyridoxamine 5'-phosphate oxidase family protein [Rhizohabitans arisaemae]
MVSADAINDGKPGPASDRVKVRRRAMRGSYDPELVHAILDEAFMCHVAFVDDGGPVVLPTLHVRRDDVLYIHGSPANRMIKRVSEGVPVCVEATILDSLTLSRAVAQNSVNYRSVVAFGSGSEVLDPVLKREVMLELIDRVVPGRLDRLRPMTEKELRGVRVIAVELSEYSAKVRTGPPTDHASDYDWPVWAGEVPLRIVPGTPIPDPALPADTAVPEHVLSWGSDRRGV